MVSIGIGITTYNRPECLKECLQHIYKHTFMDNVTLYVATDTNEDRKGVAFRKNECLKSLKNCDHIFLFDDDCYPINDGWIEFFINANKEHLLYLNKNHVQLSTDGHCSYYHDCAGVFMYIRKDALDRVGAFDEKFMHFGFEHADYSIRILGERHAYPMLNGTDNYIYSKDYSDYLFHSSSISILERNEHIKNNWDKFFNEPIKSVFLPL